MNTHAIYKMAVRLFWGGALSVTTLSSALAVTPSQTPLTTGSSAVLPNIMLMLDNSGSMSGDVPSGGTTTFKRISVSSPSNITSYLPSLGNFQCNTAVTGGTNATNATEINMLNNSGTPRFCTAAATAPSSQPCTSGTNFSANRCFNNSQYYKIRVYAATTTKTSAALPLWEAFTGQQLNWYFNVANVTALEGNEQLQQVFANSANLTANASSTSSADVDIKRMMMLKTATRALLNDLKPTINATTGLEDKPKVRLGLSTFEGQCGDHQHDCNDGGALLQAIGDLTRSKTEAILDYVGDTVIGKTGTNISYTGLLTPTAYTPLGETQADIGFYFSEGETNLNYPKMPYTVSGSNPATTAYTTAQSVTRQALFNAGTVIDNGKTEGIVNIYLVNTAFTGAALGNVITENIYVDASNNQQTRWQNETTLTTLTTNPDTNNNLWDSLIDLNSTVNISGIYRVNTAFTGAGLNNLITYNPSTGKWRNESWYTTLSAAPVLSRLTLLNSKTYSLANLSDDDGKVDGLRLDGPAADMSPLLPPIKDWCQKSYTIVVTDGEPTQDDKFGPLVQSFYNNSTITSYLATVAGVLYNMDLRPTLGVNATQKAFLNNVSTYAINVGDASAETLDEVAKLGGTTNAYSANDVPQLTAIFNKVIKDIQSKAGSFSAVVANSSKLDANTAIFQASYDTADWTGDFIALKLNETTGIPDPTPVWQAGKLIPKCKGSTECSASTYRNIFTYNTTNKGVKFNGASASAICALLSPYQKNNLNATGTGGACDTEAQRRLDWLRGDISYEKTNDQFGYVTSPASTDPRLSTPVADRVFRNRVRYWQDTSVAVAATATEAAIPAHTLGDVRQDAWLLGDIVNSDAAYVSDENYGYSKLPAADGGDKYAQFVKDNASRTKMTYIGANDGMLHGFNASLTEANKGKEILAFMPESVFADFKNLSKPDYSHQYFVDGSPRVGDAYFSSDSKWHTVLVGTTGAGGKGVFALDVTNPSSFSASNVLWEISNVDTPNPTHIATSQSLNDKADFAANMGYSLPQASIGKLHNGKWAAIVANGYDSTSKKAVLYVIDVRTGEIIRTLDTLVGGGAVDNGLSTPFTADVDADGVIDVVYAGDLLGNMWKFDVSADSEADWKVAYGTKSVPAPLFTACNGAATCTTTSTRQAITNKPQVGRATDPAQGKNGVMVYFGTGKYFEDTDNDSKQIQSFYGVWDECPLVSSSTPASKHSCPTSVPKTNLQEQSILKELAPSGTITESVRLTSNTPVKYATPQASACITAKTCQQGWYIDFKDVNNTTTPENGERIVSASLLRGGRIIFTTLIPQPVAQTGVDSCSPEADSTSWLMELNAISGSRLGSATPALDINGNGTVGLDDIVKGQLPDGTDAPASGIKATNGSSKTPAVIGKDSATELKILSSSKAKTAQVIGESANQSDDSTQGRLSWRQLP